MVEFFGEEAFFRGIGVFIGLVIIFYILKFIRFGIAMIIMHIRDVMLCFAKNTKAEEPIETFFLKVINLLSRFKWSDPRKDLDKDLDRAVDKIYYDKR